MSGELSIISTGTNACQGWEIFVLSLCHTLTCYFALKQQNLSNNSGLAQTVLNYPEKRKRWHIRSC
ncbi:hypothetical protein T11_8722 [Trichinella zimbabwensis]|uniref:Uncharacterized protein n=1 Tax=Trichinella zimbabwensis TaxID=268475 RepID=A0A0V1HXG9_9BILA|nr:hypothetical protein T11_8722 [Trichinella zimbabwensis]